MLDSQRVGECSAACMHRQELCELRRVCTTVPQAVGSKVLEMCVSDLVDPARVRVWALLGKAHGLRCLTLRADLARCVA